MRKRESEKERGKEEERQQHWVRDEHSRRAVSDVENFLSSGNCIPLPPPSPPALPMSLPLPLLLLLSLDNDPISISNRTPRPAPADAVTIVVCHGELPHIPCSCTISFSTLPPPSFTSPSPLVVRCSRLINFCAVACSSLNPCALWCHVRNCTYHFCYLPTSLSVSLPLHYFSGLQPSHMPTSIPTPLNPRPIFDCCFGTFCPAKALHIVWFSRSFSLFPISVRTVSLFFFWDQGL